MDTTHSTDFTEMWLNGFREKVLSIVFLVLMVYEQIWWRLNGGDFTFSIKEDWFCALCSFLQKNFFEW